MKQHQRNRTDQTLFSRIVRYALCAVLGLCALIGCSYLEAFYIARTIPLNGYTDSDFYHKGFLAVYAVSRCWEMGCRPSVRPVFWANPLSFQKLNSLYAKDIFSVFCDHEVIWEASYPQHHVQRIAARPASFQALSSTFAKDAVSAFFTCSKIPVTDVSSFTPIDTYLAHDAMQFYFKTTATAIPYLKTSQVLPLENGDNGYLIVQDDGLYCLEHQQTPRSTYDLRLSHSKINSQPIDRATFEYLGDGYATDAQHTYFHCQILEASAAPKYLGNYYLTIGNHVYYNGKLLTKANAQNFKVITAEEFKERKITKNITYGVPQEQPPYANKTVGFDGHYYFIFGKTVEPLNYNF